MGAKHSKVKIRYRVKVTRSLSANIEPLSYLKRRPRSLSTTTELKMGDYLKVDDMKEAVMECPICSYIYDSEDRAPRLMPCCVSSCCTKCLSDIIARSAGNTIDCPLCRKIHELPEDHLSLFPLERVILKMVEYLKVQKGHQMPCTGCPDENKAMSRCKDCGLFLCTECLNAHRRNGITRDHTIISFDDLRSQSIQNFNSSHHCPIHKMNPLQFYCYKCDKVICVSCTVVDHKEVNGHNIASIDQVSQERSDHADAFMTKLDARVKYLAAKADDLKKKKKILTTSKTSAVKQVESTFDSLIAELLQRKHLMLTEIETRYDVHNVGIQLAMKQTESLLSRVVSASEYISHVRNTADDIEAIQLFSRVKHILDDIIKEEPDSFEWKRKGLGFDPTLAPDMIDLINQIGVIKTVTYMDDQTNDDAQTLYIQPANWQKASTINSRVTVCGRASPNRKKYEIDSLHSDRIIVLGEVERDGDPAVILCPRLRFDTICQSRDCTVTPDGTFVNRKLQKSRSASGSETGCRMKVGRRVLCSTPFLGDRSQLWQMKLDTKIKTPTSDNSMIFEAALTPKPVDAAFAQPSGFSLNLSHCDNHNKLCLKIRRDGELQADIPAILNQSDIEHVLHLSFLLDGEKQLLHVFDVLNNTAVITVDRINTSLPLWMVYYLDTPEESDMSLKLTSGVDVEVTDNLLNFLNNVCDQTLCDV